MLMRLARGSGTGGLAAPRPVQILPQARVNLRPLLTLKKAELIDALRKAGAGWREDGSNARGDYFRNRVRLDVIPGWTLAAQRDALAGAARSRELLEEDELALEAWLDDLGALQGDGSLNVKILAGKPRALVRRALHRWLLRQPQAGDLSRAGFDGLLAAVERGSTTRQSLGVAGFARLRGGVLRFERVGKNRPRFRGRTN
jgi:tRNA(Ile)-lysidine synthase